jgi:hypothetical protein
MHLLIPSKAHCGFARFFMTEQLYRLGDLIDDYCTRCRLLLNHAVASMVDDQVVKVICQTCYTEHAYQHGKVGKKKPSGRSTLFDQVLASIAPSEADAPAAPPAKKKKSDGAARYITRHKSKTRRGD